MQDNNSNFLMAVVLSLGVLLGWQFFVVEPRLAEERARQLAAAEQALAEASDDSAVSDLDLSAPAPSTSAPSIAEAPDRAGAGKRPAPLAKRAAQDAFADSPRLRIETDQLSGSIALMGARFDDLILADYAETLAADAPRQGILHPENENGHWQIHHGWVGGEGANVTLPGLTSLWRIVEGTVLTPTSPVTLTHTTPEGVELRQRIEVDNDFMFTITHLARNNTDTCLLYTSPSPRDR